MKKIGDQQKGWKNLKLEKNMRETRFEKNFNHRNRYSHTINNSYTYAYTSAYANYWWLKNMEIVLIIAETRPLIKKNKYNRDRAFWLKKKMQRHQSNEYDCKASKIKKK